METGEFQKGNEIDTPEQLRENLKKPMSSELAGKLNNKAVELFVNGKLNPEQLATFSVDLASSADNWAEANLKLLQSRPQDSVDTWKRGEFQKIHQAQNIAKECRTRAVMITMPKTPSK